MPVNHDIYSLGIQRSQIYRGGVRLGFAVDAFLGGMNSNQRFSRLPAELLQSCGKVLLER